MCVKMTDNKYSDYDSEGCGPRIGDLEAFSPAETYKLRYAK